MKTDTIYNTELKKLPTHVNKITWRTARRVIENHHYLGYAPAGMKLCLGVFCDDDLLGVMIWGRPVARKEDQNTTLELTRMFLFSSPKNSESKAISLAEKYIKKNHPDIIRLIAYSDTEQGHTGTIYKAANWNQSKKVKSASWGNRPNRMGKIGGDKLKFERILYKYNHQ